MPVPRLAPGAFSVMMRGARQVVRSQGARGTGAGLAAVLVLGAAPSTLGQAPPAVVPADTLQATAADTTRTVHITAGGRVHGEKRGGERVVDYDGGVRLTSETTTIESRRATQYPDREHVFFYGDVEVHDGDVVMQGREGDYLRPAERAEMRGDVRIRDRRGLVRARRARFLRHDRLLWLWGDVDFQDEKTRVQADSVLYREATGIGDAWGRVVATDRATNSEVTGSHAVYDRASGEVFFDASPVVVLRDSAAAETRVEPREVRLDRDQTVVVARGDVRIARGKSTATADSALLYHRDDRAALRGRPAIAFEDSRLSGDAIDVQYRAGEVERVFVRGAARLVQTRQDTLLLAVPNEVLGDSATLWFENGELRRAVVTGNARSVFVPEESKPGRLSLNEATGDTVRMLFAADEVQEVVFSGNAAGTYRFLDDAAAVLGRMPGAAVDTTFGVVRGDTARVDFQSRAETVRYAAERVLYLAAQNDLHLIDAAEVDYQNQLLRAGRIHYDADTDVLDARDRPVLQDAGDRIYGDTMGYDLESRQAWIENGSTLYDQGFYSGRRLRRREEGVLEVRDGRYTTCDLAEPHYHFRSDRMKIYLKDKVVGRPVWLYLGHVPFLYLPFFANSANTARHSGFLQPDIEFGVAGQSRFIRGLDYYWAASSYFDFLFSTEYQERPRPNRSSFQAVLGSAETRSVRLGVRARYKLRYSLDGNVDYNIRRTFDPGSSVYTIRGEHRQTIGDRSSLNGSLDYSSSSTAYRETYQNLDYNRARQRQISSGLTYSRRGDLVSFNANVRRLQQLDTGDRFEGALIERTLPSLNVSFRTIRLGPAPANPRDTRSLRGFLHSLTLAPAVSFSRLENDVRVARDTLLIPPGGVPLADSFFVRTDEVVTASTGAGLSRQTSLWIFNLSPSVSYAETYLRDSRRPDDKHFRRSVSTGTGIATTFYGIFHPQRFGLEAIRHQIEPRASISYVPEIRGQQLRRTTVGLSLRNQIDVKVRHDTTLARRDGVFEWALSTSYDPTRLGPPGQPDRKFGNISSGITLNRQGPLRLTVSQDYDPYTGKIVSTRIPFAVRFSGSFGYGDTGGTAARRNRVVEEEGEPTAADSVATPPPEPALDPLADVQSVDVGRRGDLTWGLGASYSLVRERGRTRNGAIGLGLEVQPTKSWRLTYSASYDTGRRELGSPEFRITRDLHCWKASFARVFLGGEWRYYFRIWVNKHAEDLFVESGERTFGYGY